jgi:LysM repeat protein
MTRKQMVFIIVVNALISTAISITVILFVILLLQFGISAPETAVSVPPRVTASSSPLVEATMPAVASPMPSATPMVYIVKSGDTLSSLALSFDVPAADIIAANQIQNANFLPVGLELIIPLGGVPPSTVAWTPVPTATGSPIPFEPPSAALTATASMQVDGTVQAEPSSGPTPAELGIAITEVSGVGQVDSEQVVITNLGDQVADMVGWSLSDDDGNQYTFPNYRLWSGGTVTLHSRVGQDGSPVTSLFWGKLQAVWEPGETASLKDATGQVVATFSVGP